MRASRLICLMAATVETACGGSATGEVVNTSGTADAEPIDVSSALEGASHPMDSISGSASDAATTEAVSDVPSTSDALKESPVDGGMGPDAPPTWCQLVKALFCSDFDGTPFDQVWNTHSIVGDAAVEAATRFRSGPYGFHSTIPHRSAGSPGAEGRLVRVFPQTATKAKLSFDIFVDPFQFDDGDPTRPGGIDFFSIDRGASAASLRMERSTTPFQTSLEITNPIGATGYLTIIPLAFGRWVHVEIGVLYGNYLVGSVEVKFDGVVVQSLAGEHTLYEPVSTAVTLYVGVRGAGKGPAVSATYDNLTLDLDP